ncbi:MAG: hypothetical protein J6T10_21170 [Methanobrevibacter sp.]|nr:hypothetical protein [Methanobrevibacter sp.]
MINIRTIRRLTNNDGLTLKNGKIINYKSGWQVATEGIETTNINEVIPAIKKYSGNYEVWFADGIYYIDKSFRVDIKKEALSIGRAHNQISIFGWKRSNLTYC